MSQGVTELQK